MRRRLDHTLPPWVKEDAAFFVTINAHDRGENQLCQSPIGHDILSAIRQYQDERKWLCSVALLMPDHLHMIVHTAQNTI